MQVAIPLSKKLITMDRNFEVLVLLMTANEGN
jgi:hypothetical protein